MHSIEGLHQACAEQSFKLFTFQIHFLSFGHADLLRQGLATVYSPVQSLFVFISCFLMTIVALALLCQTYHVDKVLKVL